jgi:hypothetical protein
MGYEHEHSSQRSQSPTRVRDVGWLTGPQILKAVIEMIDNTGLRSETLYVSKLGCAKIIPTSEQKISTAG